MTASHPYSAQSPHSAPAADEDSAASLESWQGLVIGGNAVIDALLTCGDRTLKVLRAEVDLNLASLKWLVMLSLLATAVAGAAVIALNAVVAGMVALWIGAGWLAGWGAALLVDIVLLWLAGSAIHQLAQNFGFNRTWGALSASRNAASAPTQDDSTEINENREPSK